MTPTPARPEPNRHGHDVDKAYMLELINAERAKEGLNPVALGRNTAAQIHAENSLKGCFSGHWGLDGTKPYMRYALAGGYQVNKENVSGLDYCTGPDDGYAPVGTIRPHIAKAMAGLMKSAGHRRNIMNPLHKTVSIGIAHDEHNINLVQHFAGDYVHYDRKPAISNGILSLAGRLKNGARLDEYANPGVHIAYDPPPRPLTPAQVARVYCYDEGELIAALRPPLPDNQYYPNSVSELARKKCADPHAVPANAPPAQSPADAARIWQQAYDQYLNRDVVRTEYPWLTARTWTARNPEFDLTADLSDLLRQHGPGVYTVTLWALIGDEILPASSYPIFHNVDPPAGYR